MVLGTGKHMISPEFNLKKKQRILLGRTTGLANTRPGEQVEVGSGSQSLKPHPDKQHTDNRERERQGD